MEKGPVTGAPASLLMATVGDVVSASTQLSCSPAAGEQCFQRVPFPRVDRQLVFESYSSLTAMTRSANHAPVRAGVHSPATPPGGPAGPWGARQALAQPVLPGADGEPVSLSFRTRLHA